MIWSCWRIPAVFCLWIVIMSGLADRDSWRESVVTTDTLQMLPQTHSNTHLDAWPCERTPIVMATLKCSTSALHDCVLFFKAFRTRTFIYAINIALKHWEGFISAQWADWRKGFPNSWANRKFWHNHGRLMRIFWIIVLHFGALGSFMLQTM